MDHKEEIYHIFEQETVRRNKRLEGYERTEAISRAISYCSWWKRSCFWAIG